MNTAEQAARAFCSELFAGADESLADYQVNVSSWPGPSVRWLQGCDPEQIASAVLEADARGGGELAVYLCMAPRSPGAAHRKPDGSVRRGGIEDVGALLGVWADLDWLSPAHQNDKRLPDDEAAVRRILAAANLTPTLVWRSGHGLQAFWGLAEPWIFADSDDETAARSAAGELCRNWQLTLAMHAHRLGRWQIDSTGNLDRILRPAGTTNRKIPGDARRVEIVTHNPGARYDVADIEVALAPQKVLDRFAGMADIPADSPAKDVDLHGVWAMVTTAEYRARGYTPEWLTIMLEEGLFRADSPIVRIFRDGNDEGHSETDASLARRVAMLDMDPVDAVEIIMCRHLRTGHKLDKVDPHRRTDYVVRTVARVFESERAKRAERAARVAAGQRLVTAQDEPAPDDAPGAVAAADLPDPGPGPQWPAEPPQRPSVGPSGASPAETPPEQPAPRPAPADGVPVLDPTDAADNLGAAIVAELADDVHAVRPGPEPEREPEPVRTAEPVPDEPPDDPTDEDAPPDDPDPHVGQDHESPDGGDPEGGPTGAPSAGTSSGSHDAPDDAPDDGPQDPPADEPPPIADEPERSDPDEQPTPERPAIVRPVTAGGRGTWGSRTRPQHDTLTAVSEALLGDLTHSVIIWRCQTRGRGAKAERRLVLRVARGYQWPVSPPAGYVPGLPYATGWWPAGTFDKVGGWTKVLQQECLLITRAVKAEEFAETFGRALIRMWEPDDSGGSLDNVTRDAMRSYLSDYPLLADWHDASAQGMPYILQAQPRWRLDTPFSVLVRWADFGQHTRSHFGINTSPAVLTEMAELAGARPARTLTQNGRWRSVRREYLTDDEWTAILAGAEIAAQQREERHGLQVMRGGLYGAEPTDERADDPEHRRQR